MERSLVPIWDISNNPSRFAEQLVSIQQQGVCDVSGGCTLCNRLSCNTGLMSDNIPPAALAEQQKLRLKPPKDRIGLRFASCWSGDPHRISVFAPP
jgi:L-rhamnose isomerase